MVVDRGRELAPLLQALADPTRLGIVQLLSIGPRRAGELAEESGLSAAATSKHLRVLLQAGVVADERPSGGRAGSDLPASTGVGGRTASVARSASSAVGRPAALVQTTC